MQIKNRFSNEIIGDFDIGPGANLRGVNLRGAHLSGVNLSRADLRGANLSEANLSRAELSGANLRGVNLRGANLRGANLRGVDLREADLRGANLRGANLSRADLRGANLRGADLDWSSHELISEILRQAAGNDINRRMIAGLILLSKDLCWKDFLKIEHPEKNWAISELRKFEKDHNLMPIS